MAEPNGMDREVNSGSQTDDFHQALEVNHTDCEPVVVWGASGGSPDGDLVDMIFVRCCLGICPESNGRLVWVICGELGMDRRNLRMRLIGERHRNHSHAAEALVVVRILHADDELHTNWTILSVSIRGLDNTAGLSVHVAPDLRGLVNTIDQYVRDGYSDDDTTIHQDNHAG